MHIYTRLSTFSDWPLDWLDPTLLAKDGFFYMKVLDSCACIFCNQIIGKWEKGDIPRKEHEKFSPMCPFVNGIAIGNITIDQSNALQRIQKNKGKIKDFDNKRLPEEKNQEHEEEGEGQRQSIIIDSFKQTMDVDWKSHSIPIDCELPRYKYLDTRLISFDKWPENLSQHSRDMAEAGFWYTGIGDHVKCYHCGNGLRNWEKNEKPWEAHARWYPKCGFVSLKGSKYVVYAEQQYIQKLYDMSPGSEECYSDYSMYDHDLDILMECDVIKALVSNGFNKYIIKDALKAYIEEHFKIYNNVDECTDSLNAYLKNKFDSKTLPYNIQVHENDEINRHFQMAIQQQDDYDLRQINCDILNNEISDQGGSYNRWPTGRPTSIIRYSDLPRIMLVKNTSREDKYNVGRKIMSRVESYFPATSNNPIPLKKVIVESHVTYNSFLDDMIILLKEGETTYTDISFKENVISTTSIDNNLNTHMNFQNITNVLSNRNEETDSGSDDDIEILSIVREYYDDNNNINNINNNNNNTHESMDFYYENDEQQPESDNNRPESDNNREHNFEVLSVDREDNDDVITINNNNNTNDIDKNEIKIKPDIMNNILNMLKTMKKELETIKEKSICKVCLNNDMKRELDTIKEKYICKICHDKDIDIILLPCHHIIICSICLLKDDFPRCPCCRKSIKYATRLTYS
nr:MAG: baculoviral IAP repeat-containing protein [Metapenaeopsis lamellata majanivirus]